MKRFEISLIVFLILLIIIYLIDYLFIKRKYLKILEGKKKRKKTKELMEITYLVNKFKLNKDLLPMNSLTKEICFINAFIISFVIAILMLLNINIFFQLIIGFVLLLALIYSLYELLGRHLVRKGY